MDYREKVEIEKNHHTLKGVASEDFRSHIEIFLTPAGQHWHYAAAFRLRYIENRKYEPNLAN